MMKIHKSLCLAAMVACSTTLMASDDHNPFVGVYVVSAIVGEDEDGPEFFSLVTIHADGTLSRSDMLQHTGPDDSGVGVSAESTDAHGTWKRVSNNRIFTRSFDFGDPNNKDLLEDMKLLEPCPISTDFGCASEVTGDLIFDDNCNFRDIGNLVLNQLKQPTMEPTDNSVEITNVVGKKIGGRCDYDDD